MRENNITIIHIIAALLVMFGHQFALLGMYPPPTVMGIDSHGLGVRVLFLISGYLVSGSYLRSEKKARFLLKRLIRLYPSLIVCLVMTIICLYPCSRYPQHYWNSAIDYFLYNLRMFPKFDLAGVFENNPFPLSINGSLWTLPIEVACYILIIPVTDLVRRLQKRSGILGAVVLITLLVILSVTDIIRSLYYADSHAIFYGTDWLNAVNLMIWFIIGISIRLLKLEKYCNWQIALIASLVFVLTKGIIHIILIPYIISYIVMCFALADKPAFANTFKRDVCYGLYLYAFWVQQLMIYLITIRLGQSVSVYFLYGFSVIFTWGLAELNYRFVETPCTKFFDKLLTKLTSKEDVRVRL